MRIDSTEGRCGTATRMMPKKNASRYWDGSADGSETTTQAVKRERLVVQSKVVICSRE
jgi:hypothetical protein